MTTTMVTTLRIARATRHLERIVEFYVGGLGLTVLGSFHGHEGYDGVMLGLPGAPFHLEFTLRRGRAGGGVPDEDDLLVFYIPDRDAWQASIDRLHALGRHRVAAANPYWDRHGWTFVDPDGNRLVLENSAWSP
ncbi:MAG TPA: VOC family protein [Candidatus Polarisedimenticolia bacterium]|nr:VOC family protein [Candidatus Polarisedimenticolia bacterium]